MLPKALGDSEVYRRLLQSADADGNARVDREELDALVRRHVSAQVKVRFGRLDRNGDGQVTRAEVPRMSTARFARFDLDADGSFTAGELARVMLEKAHQTCERVLARLDVDGDGAVSAPDLDSAPGRRVSKLEARR